MLSVHPYYEENKQKFKKEMMGFLAPVKKELEEETKQEYDSLFNEIWSCYEENFLENFPYIGGNKASGTRNLTGAFSFVAMGEVLTKKYNVPLERWGYLTTLSYRRYFDKIPDFMASLAGRLMGNEKLLYKMLVKKDEKNRINSEENPGSFETRAETPYGDYAAIYNTLVCPLNNFARKFGYTEYMPYICNLDYVMFQKLKVPFYREKTLAAGDDLCDFKMKKGAPVNAAWPCHSLTPGDPLK